MKKQSKIPEINSSFLNKMEKKNSFSVPNNYFEELPKVINNKILNNKKLRFSFDILSWRILAPTSLLFIVLIIVFNQNNSFENIHLTSEELSELIIEESYNEIDDYMVYEAYAEILEENQENNNDSETEQYIDYLIDNDIDINTIIEEL